MPTNDCVNTPVGPPCTMTSSGTLRPFSYPAGYVSSPSISMPSVDFHFTASVRPRAGFDGSDCTFATCFAANGWIAAT